MIDISAIIAPVVKRVRTLKQQVEERRPGEPCCLPGVAPRLTDAQSEEAAELFKALADPARLQILDILSQHAGLVCACDLEGRVGRPDARTGERPKQPTISHHLKVLRDAGLIEAEKHGLWVFYFLNRERLAGLKRLLNNLCCKPE